MNPIDAYEVRMLVGGRHWEVSNGRGQFVAINRRTVPYSERANPVHLGVYEVLWKDERVCVLPTLDEAISASCRWLPHAKKVTFDHSPRRLMEVAS